jgi:hypothetical protein
MVVTMVGLLAEPLGLEKAVNWVDNLEIRKVEKKVGGLVAWLVLM